MAGLCSQTLYHPLGGFLLHCKGINAKWKDFFKLEVLGGLLCYWHSKWEDYISLSPSGRIFVPLQTQRNKCQVAGFGFKLEVTQLGLLAGLLWYCLSKWGNFMALSKYMPNERILFQAWVYWKAFCIAAGQSEFSDSGQNFIPKSEILKKFIKMVWNCLKFDVG